MAKESKKTSKPKKSKSDIVEKKKKKPKSKKSMTKKKAKKKSQIKAAKPNILSPQTNGRHKKTFDVTGSHENNADTITVELYTVANYPNGPVTDSKQTNPVSKFWSVKFNNISDDDYIVDAFVARPDVSSVQFKVQDGLEIDFAHGPEVQNTPYGDIIFADGTCAAAGVFFIAYELLVDGDINNVYTNSVSLCLLNQWSIAILISSILTDIQPGFYTLEIYYHDDSGKIATSRALRVD